MGLTLTLRITLLLGLGLSIQARAPGLYYPPPGEGFHTTQIRSHLEQGSLTPLTENELETLLYLLDKVQRPSHAPKYGEERNKRTGAHHLSNIAAKRAHMSDYFGIDKREAVRPADLPHDNPATRELVPTPTTTTKQAQNDREAILREFYQNMAMSANVKRKREIRADKGRVEQEFGRIGDKLVSDALKLVGKHRDEQLSGEDLKNLKEEIIQRIGAAYSVEKLRQVLMSGGDGEKTESQNNNPTGQ